MLEQQLQTVQSGLSQLEIGIFFNYFLETKIFDDSQLVDFLHQEWEKIFDT